MAKTEETLTSKADREETAALSVSIAETAERKAVLVASSVR